MNKNYGVKCDVKKCAHNFDGENCSLTTIKVTCGCSDCTCCGDFCEKK